MFAKKRITNEILFIDLHNLGRRLWIPWLIHIHYFKQLI